MFIWFKNSLCFRRKNYNSFRKKEGENEEEKFELHQELKSMQLKNGNLVSGGGDGQSKNRVHRMEIKNWRIIIFFFLKY